MGISAEKQVELLRTMFRIRAFEERVRDLFAAGRLPGFVHLSIGQEGVVAGAFGAQVAAWIAEEVFDAPVRGWRRGTFPSLSAHRWRSTSCLR
ncbi:MAG: hypothetical protein AAB253_04915 [candidate division NC10 bacterium]